MERIMGSRVREIKNEGLGLALILIETIHRVISKGISRVEILIRIRITHNYFVLDGPAP